MDRKISQGLTLDQVLLAASDCWESESLFSPGTSSLVGAPVTVGSPKHIYTWATLKGCVCVCVMKRSWVWEEVEENTEQRGRHRDYVKHIVHMEFSKFKLETTLNRLEYIFLQRILRILATFMSYHLFKIHPFPSALLLPLVLKFLLCMYFWDRYVCSPN